MLFMPYAILMADSGLPSYNRQIVSFKHDKTWESITCVQDSYDETLWYYISNKPRLAENQNGNPMMKLVSFQKNQKAGVRKDGGIFQCAVNLSLPSDALSKLKKELANSIDMPESKITLAPLDMKNAKFMVYTTHGDLLGDQIIALEIGSSFANECLPIQMTLDNLSVSATESLTKGTDGLQVYFLFDYDVFTPESSIKVTASYDKAFEHFSENSKASISARKWFILGSRADTSLASLREDLTHSGVLEIESIDGEELTEERMDKIIQPVLEKLIYELYEIKTPEKIETVKSERLKKEISKFWFNLIENMTLKSEKTRKTGELVYDFRAHSVATRRAVVGGTLSLDGYSEAQRQEAIQTVDPTYWKNAYYSLPTISKALKCVDEITLTVSFLYKGKQAGGTEKQLVKWNKNKGWVNAKNEDCIGLEFPLQYFYKLKGDKNVNFSEDLEFQQSFQITYMEGNDTKIKTFTSTVPAFTNSIPISIPMVGVTYIELNAKSDYLTWDKDIYKSGEYKDLKSNLTKIGVKFETKNPSSRVITNLTSKNTSAGLWFDNIFDKKTGLYIIPQISATYTFYNGKLAKAMNTKDKRTIVLEKEDALSEGSSIIFMDDDYMPIEKPETYK